MGERGGWGGGAFTSRCLLFVRSSLEALVQQRGGEATEKELCGHPQTKQKAGKDKFTGK